MSSKVVLITGANRGLGKGLIEALLSSPNKYSTTIIMTSRDLSKGQAALNQITEKFPTEILKLYQLDVTDHNSISAFAYHIQEKHNKIDVLVNNAGVMISTFSYETTLTTLNTNFYGLYNLTTKLLPLVSDTGHIINLSALLGNTTFIPNKTIQEQLLSPSLTIEQLLGLAKQYVDSVKDGNFKDLGWPRLPYNVSKAFVNAYTRILHKEFRDKNTGRRANALHPGWVKTDLGGKNAPLTIEEGVKTAAFLVSDSTQESGKFWHNSKIEPWK
jgi:carbonyl reductase 1